MDPLQSVTDELQLKLGRDRIGKQNGVVVLLPESTEEVALIARYGMEHLLRLEIAGAGTKRGWGAEVTADLVLNMTRMRGVLEHVWQDLTATVAAGTPWAQMQAALATHGQRVALDPLWPDTATVGGIIATNDSGSLRSAYGSMRDLIIGMKVVLADGTIARTGGKVVKNVAGYDVHKLMTGAFGTLGVITEVTFRLHPLPKCEASWTVTSKDLFDLHRCRALIVESPRDLQALQIRTCQDGFALDIGLATLPELMDEARETFATLIAPLILRVAEEKVWSARESCFREDRATVKITGSRERMMDQILMITNAGGECVMQECGILLAMIAPEPSLIRSLRECVDERGGSLTLLQWPSGVDGKPDIWGNVGSSFSLMREIKQQFDPGRMLNPGRFVGGL